jgi:hypothetical protein
MATWVVEPNALGGWDVRSFTSAQAAFRTSNRQTAEEWIRSRANPGDHVVTTNGNGQTLARFVQPAASPLGTDDTSAGMATPQPRPARPAPGTPSVQAAFVQSHRPPPSPEATSIPPVNPPSLSETLEKEGGRWDDVLDLVVPGVAAGFAGAVSPVVEDAAGGGWFAVFLATLTWSLGLAGATYFIVTQKLQSWNAVGAVAGCLLGALIVAGFLGVGVLDVEFATGGGHPVVGFILAFVVAAFTTYGWFGAVLSGGIGIWLGLRFAKRWPDLAH